MQSKSIKVGRKYVIRAFLGAEKQTVTVLEVVQTKAVFGSGRIYSEFWCLKENGDRRFYKPAQFLRAAPTTPEQDMNTLVAFVDGVAPTHYVLSAEQVKAAATPETRQPETAAERVKRVYAEAMARS